MLSVDELRERWLGAVIPLVTPFKEDLTPDLDALASNVPEMHGHLAAIADAMGSDSFDQTLEREFTAIDIGAQQTHPAVDVVADAAR